MVARRRGPLSMTHNPSRVNRRYRHAADADVDEEETKTQLHPARMLRADFFV